MQNFDLCSTVRSLYMIGNVRNSGRVPSRTIIINSCSTVYSLYMVGNIRTFSCVPYWTILVDRDVFIRAYRINSYSTFLVVRTNTGQMRNKIVIFKRTNDLLIQGRQYAYFVLGTITRTIFRLTRHLSLTSCFSFIGNYSCLCLCFEYE